MAKKSSLYDQMGSGGEIPHSGRVKQVMNLFDKREAYDSAGHCIINPKEAIMGAFDQALKSKNKLKNEHGIFNSEEPEEMFRNF